MIANDNLGIRGYVVLNILIVEHWVTLVDSELVS